MDYTGGTAARTGLLLVTPKGLVIRPQTVPIVLPDSHHQPFNREVPSPIMPAPPEWVTQKPLAAVGGGGRPAPRPGEG